MLECSIHTCRALSRVEVFFTGAVLAVAATFGGVGALEENEKRPFDGAFFFSTAGSGAGGGEAGALAALGEEKEQGIQPPPSDFFRATFLIRALALVVEGGALATLGEEEGQGIKPPPLSDFFLGFFSNTGSGAGWRDRGLLSHGWCCRRKNGNPNIPQPCSLEPRDFLSNGRPRDFLDNHGSLLL